MKSSLILSLIMFVLTFSSNVFAKEVCSETVAAAIVNHHNEVFSDAHLTELKYIDEKAGLYRDGRAGRGYSPKYEIYVAGLTDAANAALYLIVSEIEASCSIVQIIRLD